MLQRMVMAVLLVASVLGCQSDSVFEKKQLAMSREAVSLPDAEEIRRRCLEQIPPGTAIDEAEKIMTTNGFSCEHRTDKSGKYLACVLKNGQRQSLTTKWTASIRYADGVVESIAVNSPETRRR